LNTSTTVAKRRLIAVFGLDRNALDQAAVAVADVERAVGSLRRAAAVDDAQFRVAALRPDGEVSIEEIDVTIALTVEHAVGQLDDVARGGVCDGGLDGRVVTGPIGVNHVGRRGSAQSQAEQG